MAPVAPKFPDPTSPSACVEYLLQFWRILGGEGPGPEAAGKRIEEARSQKTAQAAIARAIYLGPAPAVPGAEKWLKVALNLQKYVERITKERPIASKLGGALADVAGAVQHAASSAASSASGAARTAATAVATKAAELSSSVIPTPGDLVSNVLEMPKNLAIRVTDKISETFPAIGSKLKEIAGGTAIGIIAVGAIAVGSYALFMVLSLRFAFKILPKLLSKIL